MWWSGVRRRTDASPARHSLGLVQLDTVADVPMPRLNPPMPLAGDGPGPFASSGGRRLRVLIALPPSDRRPDNSVTNWETLGVPEPARFLWSLGLREDIDLFWLAGPGEPDEIGTVRFQKPDHDADQLRFTAVEREGGSIRAVWPYRQWKTLAERVVSKSPGAGGEELFQLVMACGAATQLRVDLLVTACQPLLASDERQIREVNPMLPTDSLAVAGLYLRNRREYPMVAPAGLTFGEHLLMWTAARSQLPEGWRWGSALVSHSHAVDRDGPLLLFGSLHERIVRVFRYRDQIHTSLLVRQDNHRADSATESAWV